VFDTHVAIYIPLGTCVQMIVLFILTRFNDLIYYDDLFFTSPREWYFDTSTLVSFYPCAFVAAFVTLIVNVALSVGVDELSLTVGQFMFVTGCNCVVMLWFAFDASCMVRKVSADEYMQAIVFFYTDIILFIVFLGVVGFCLAIGARGNPGCFQMCFMCSGCGGAAMGGFHCFRFCGPCARCCCGTEEGGEGGTTRGGCFKDGGCLDYGCYNVESPENEMAVGAENCRDDDVEAPAAAVEEHGLGNGLKGFRGKRPSFLGNLAGGAVKKALGDAMGDGQYGDEGVGVGGGRWDRNGQYY